MARHKLFLREIIQTWAQWFGVGLASIVAGITLGILLRSGVGQKEARVIALSLGFMLALAFWVLIGRMFVPRPVEFATGMSTTVVQFQVGGGASGVSPAFATAILCISLYTFQQPLNLHGVVTITTHSNAIPQL